MCLAVPSKVVALADGVAEVEAFGVRRRVSLALMDEVPSPGQYVLIRAGRHAVETVEEPQALEALAYFVADGLETAFRRIQQERMQDVPILNPALRVEALGFAPWKGHWLGVVVSPWFVNLVIVRGTLEGWTEAPEGEAVMHDFPCGSLPFLGASEPEVGDFASCALSTAMHQFGSQDAAREFAREALAALDRMPAMAAESRAEGERHSMSKRRFLHSLVGGVR